MKTYAALSLATVLALLPVSALGQDAAGTAAGEVGATVDSTTGTGSTDAGGAASGTAQTGTTTTTGTTASLSIDANADGTLSVEELGAADAALAASGGATVKVDANGDGTISAEERTAAEAALNASAGSGATGSGDADDTIVAATSEEDAVTCDDSGIEAKIISMGTFDAAVAETATSVRVVEIADCEAGDIQAALAGQGAAGAQATLTANPAALAAVQARGATSADVLGATTSGDVLTVYIVSDTAG